MNQHPFTVTEDEQNKEQANFVEIHPMNEPSSETNLKIEHLNMIMHEQTKTIKQLNQQLNDISRKIGLIAFLMIIPYLINIILIISCISTGVSIFNILNNLLNF